MNKGREGTGRDGAGSVQEGEGGEFQGSLELARSEGGLQAAGWRRGDGEEGRPLGASWSWWEW
jgi:hypothetical protein